MFLRRKTALMMVIALLLGGCIKRPIMPPPERVEPAPEASLVPVPRELCSAEQGAAYGYLKRTTLVGFVVDSPMQAVDLKGIESAYPRELLRRLNLEQRLILSERSDIRLASHSLGLLGERDRGADRQVVQLAEEVGSQFVISGHLFDLTPSYHDDVIMTALKWPKRQLGVEIVVYDGYSGVVLARHHYREEVEGEVDMRPYLPFQGQFFATEYGQAFERVLRRQVEDIVNDLACLPMQARIIKIDGKQLHIDAGTASLLRPGGQLVVMRQRVEGFDLRGRPFEQQRPYGKLVLQRLYPDTAVGELVLEGGRVEELRPSDIVRAW